MTIKSILAAVVATTALIAPLTLAGPAQAAAPAGTPCVRITAPGSHTVAVGDTTEIHVRLSKACKGSKVSFNGQPPVRVTIRHLLVSTTYYLPGTYTLTVRVNPPKGEGKTVTKAVTYKVVEN